MRDDSPATRENETPPFQTPETTQSAVDTHCYELKDPSYHPSETFNHGESFNLLVLSPLFLDLVQELCHTIL